MKSDRFLLEHPVFRYDEFVAWKAASGTSHARSVKNAIQYYLNTGRIKRIRRELYACVPPNETADTLHIDPYLISAKAADDSVLAYHTALELHGFAYTTFEAYTFLSKHKNVAFEFDDRWYRAVSFPSVIAQEQSDVGIIIINRQGVNVKVTSLERTYVDILDRIELSGGWEEVSRGVNAMKSINYDQLLEYCLLLNNSRLIAKIGYMLELRQGAFSVPDRILKKLQEKKPTNPQYLFRKEHGKFQLVKRWNIVMPSHYIDQSWEEPDDTLKTDPNEGGQRK